MPYRQFVHLSASVISGVDISESESESYESPLWPDIKGVSDALSREISAMELY